jgi:hypothetical protein
MSSRDKVNFQWDDNVIRFLLDEDDKLDLYGATSQKEHVAPPGHIMLIPSQPMFPRSP